MTFYLFFTSRLLRCIKQSGYVFQIHSAVLTLHSLSQTLWVSTQQIRSCNNNIVSKTCVKICTFSYLGLFSNVSQARNWSALKIILVKHAVSFTVWDFDVQHFEWQQYIFFFFFLSCQRYHKYQGNVCLYIFCRFNTLVNTRLKP